MNYIPISIQAQKSTTFHLKRTELNLQDLLISLDSVTLLIDSQAFTLENGGEELIDMDEDVITALAVRGHNELIVIERSNYSVLDLLGDIGGLESIVFSTVALLLSVLNYNHLDNMLASQLFKF